LKKYEKRLWVATKGNKNTSNYSLIEAPVVEAKLSFL